jgi:protein kinase-like protein
MGEVFLGRSQAGRPVAVKLIYPALANDADFRRRFRLEVEASRKVGGFHAAQVVDADPDAERPWMVTAYVAGPSLEQVLREHQALPPASVRVLGAGVAEALAAIHAAGVIHRDLKPSNILLAEDGPHVIDFGIARAIDTAGITARSGTAGFMAPETLLGRPLTPACDVFALGMVLAFAIGIRPFGEGPTEAVSYRVVHEEPELGEVDHQLGELITACLAKEPGARPAAATILELLAGSDLPAQWLPPPLQTMITSYAPPRGRTLVAAADPVRAGRLLAEAEQIARTLPLTEQVMAHQDRLAAIPGPPPPPASSSARVRGLNEQYDRSLPLAIQRARALVHVAAVTARSDPAHAERLLADALHPSWDPAIPGATGYQHILEALIWHSAADLCLLLASIDASPAERLVADIAKLPPVIRARQHREFLDDVAPFVAKVAEVVAGADVASAEDLVWPMGAPARDLALAKVAGVAARSDSTRAGQIALAITGRPGQPPGRGGWKREAPPPPSMLEDPDKAIYWKVRALTEIAIMMATAGKPPASAGPAERDDPAEAGQLLAEAEEWAGAINASDLQSMALARVKVAAAQIGPDHAGQLLAEAEQSARAISGGPARLETLSEVALAAARTSPAQAEQITRGLPPDAPALAEVALAAAVTDPDCAERIAARSASGYLRALVRAAVAVRTNPADAGPLLEQAVVAAAGDSAQVAGIAIVMAAADPDGAEQVVRAITAGAGMTAGYWRARTLADLADVCFGSTAGWGDYCLSVRVDSGRGRPGHGFECTLPRRGD